MMSTQSQSISRELTYSAPKTSESIRAALAKNLVAARVLAGLTQHELAAAADVSRATIAQLEAGLSDPRLSTVVELARALGIPTLVLLATGDEVRALVKVLRDPVGTKATPADEVQRIRHLSGTGMLKDRLRAARLGAAVARSLGYLRPGSAVAAGLLGASDVEGIGVGAAWVEGWGSGI